MATNGSIGDDDGCDGWMAEAVGHSCQSIPKRFRAFRNKPLPLVAFYCGLTVRLALSCELKREPSPPAVDRFPTAGGWAKQKPPPLISMAARCAHAGPTSRRTRQSRLPDRKAARRRRGLDGRRAVVTRIYRGAPAGLHSLELLSVSCLELGLASSVRGV